MRPVRVISATLPDGRALWTIGDWGNASEHIGRRWEEVGFAALTAALADRPALAGGELRAVLNLTTDPALQEQFSSLGLPNPDVVLLVEGKDGLCLRPVDLKWSLETASYHQISAGELQALVTAARPQFAALLQAVGVPALTGSYRDGFFFAPDSRPNREFLTSPANRRQEYALEPHEVVMVPVDPVAFFSPLPGWALAERLARIDRVTTLSTVLETAERYYRLGAGIQGALVKLRTPLFSPEPAAVDVLEAFEDLARQVRPLTSANLLRAIERPMQARAERLQRLRQLHRCPYTFRDLLQDLAGHGIVVPEDDTPEGRQARRPWVQIHRTVAAEHRQAINQAGMRLLASGLNEVQALEVLERRQEAFARQARERARQLLAEALARSEGG